MTLTKVDYQHAIWAQDASNISGVVHTFDAILSKLRATEEFEAQGNPFLERHPLVTLYLDKIVSLAHGYVHWDGDDRYGEALKACKDALDAAEQPVESSDS